MCMSCNVNGTVIMCMSCNVNGTVIMCMWCNVNGTVIMCMWCKWMKASCLCMHESCHVNAREWKSLNANIMQVNGMSHGMWVEVSLCIYDTSECHYVYMIQVNGSVMSLCARVMSRDWKSHGVHMMKVTRRVISLQGWVMWLTQKYFYRQRVMWLTQKYTAHSHRSTPLTHTEVHRSLTQKYFYWQRYTYHWLIMYVWLIVCIWVLWRQ